MMREAAGTPAAPFMLRTLGLLAALLASLLSHAPAPRAASAENGRNLAAACAACHGEGGNSRSEAVPSLTGHPAPYLVVQLILFREQQRRNEIMTPLAKALSDQDIEDLAAYFAGQTRAPPHEPADAALAAQGKAVADAHRCGTCHLPDYAGREQIPRLAAQREDYLLKTMRDYKSGGRSGLDGMMTSVLHPVTDEQLVALAAFLSRLP
jgi:cytochrome c553